MRYDHTDWNTAPDALRILSEMTVDRPAKVQGLGHIITGAPTMIYDRDDIRVARLHAFWSGWFAATEDAGPTVDDAIDAYLAASDAAEARFWRKQALLGEGRTPREVEAILDREDVQMRTAGMSDAGIAEVMRRAA
jgi:hypothetical protein